MLFHDVAHRILVLRARVDIPLPAAELIEASCGLSWIIMKRVLNQKLQQVPGVTRTETFMILKMYKMSYRWGQAAPPAA